MAVKRLRECIDQEIVRFSIKDLLGCSLNEKPLSFDKNLRFDTQKQAVWRASDHEAYQVICPTKGSAWHRMFATANLLLKGEGTGLFIDPKNDIQGLVIYPRDAVIVTVAKSIGVAAKVLRKTSSQKNVIENERTAYQLLPEFVPAIIRCQNDAKSDSFDYVVSKFVPNNHPVSKEEWHIVFPAVAQALLLCYERAGFRRISVTEIMERAEGTLEKHREESEFYQLCQSVIHDINGICIRFSDANLLNTFSHGDLTWDAIHRSGDSLNIIDWGNAGYRSVFYDLFIQEFYSANPRFWRNLLDAKSLDFFSSFFYGTFDLYYQGLIARTRTDLSLFDIKANLIICLLENAVDNFVRYRVVDEQEGMEFFGHIEKIKDFLCAAY